MKTILHAFDIEADREEVHRALTVDLILKAKRVNKKVSD